MSRRTRRRRGRVFSFLLAVCFACLPLGMSIVNAPAAHALSPCDLIPDPAARAICQAAGGSGIPGIPDPSSVIGGVVGAASQAVLLPILKQFTQAEMGAVTSVLQKEVDTINNNTVPTLTADWFKRQYAIVFGFGVFAALGIYYFRLGADARNTDFGGMANSFISLMAFFIVGVSLPVLVGAIVKVVDGSITPGMLSIANVDMTAALQKLESAMTTTISSNGTIDAILLPLITLFVAVIAGIVVLFELLFRMSMLYIFTAAEVFAFAMLVGRQWTIAVFQRITMGLVGLILFKLIMAIIFMFSFGILSGAETGIDAILIGAVLCALTPILSWHAYKRIAGHDIRVMPAFAHVQKFATMVAK